MNTLSVTTCLIAFFVSLILDRESEAQVVLYDNLDNVRSDDDWHSALGPDRRYAQQFLLGNNSNVDQFSILLQRPRAGVTGSLRFELWRDNGSGKPIPVDDPTAKIADLGAIKDVTEIPVGEFGEFKFDNLILGLEANHPYWMVTDFAQVRGINGGERSIGFAANGDPYWDSSNPNPLEFDAAAGTNGAVHLHAYRNQNPYWRDLNSVFGLNHFYAAMKVEATEKVERTVSTIYDNSDTELRSGDRIVPSPGDTFFAQPFNLGPHDSITATHINVSRTGVASGDVRFSIWDNDGRGVPGQEIAELGTIDVSLLDDVGARPSEIPSVTFDTMIEGLQPDETYFIMTDVTELNISGTQRSPNSIVFGGLKNNLGTNEPDDWIAVRPNRRPPLEERDWASFSAFGLGRRWMQMAIEAISSIGAGDFNENGTLDTIDIDILSSAIRQNLSDTKYDLDRNGELTSGDRTVWVHDLTSTYFGDSNLDGEFNSGDLIEVFQAGEYEDNITINSTWAEGDWNGDGDFDTSDLVEAFKGGGFEAGQRTAVSAVPEPGAFVLMSFALLGICRLRSMR